MVEKASTCVSEVLTLTSLDNTMASVTPRYLSGRISSVSMSARNCLSGTSPNTSSDALPSTDAASSCDDSPLMLLRRVSKDVSEALTFRDSASALAPSGPSALPFKSSYDRE